jgi:hypothetical protein
MNPDSSFLRHPSNTREKTFMTPTRLGCFLAALTLCGLAVGCGDTPGRENVTIEPNQPLEEIGKLVEQYTAAKKRPPAKVQDLTPYEPGFPVGMHALSQGQCVLIYGASLVKTPEAAKSVLAYDKDAATEGGYVLMQDGTVKKMTADEFKNAPQAKK